MTVLRFHFSGPRFRSFPGRFPTLRGKEQLRFPFVSSPFPTDTVRFPFPAYRDEIGNEEVSAFK
jgi:hypothetical protein